MGSQRFIVEDSCYVYVHMACTVERHVKNIETAGSQKFPRISSLKHEQETQTASCNNNLSAVRSKADCSKVALVLGSVLQRFALIMGKS